MIDLDLNKILRDTEKVEVTDAAICQMAVHLGDDKYIYLQPKDVKTPGAVIPDANVVKAKGAKGRLDENECNLFAVELMDFATFSEEMIKEMKVSHGIGDEANYGTSYYRQLLCETVFEHNVLPF